MPGFYAENEYDLAGFSVGVVDKEKIINNARMQAGDVMIALPSSGVHSNGFSLVRHLFPMEASVLNKKYDSLTQTLGETLLTPTKIYVKPILKALEEQVDIKGISHITGGGFYENIPRAMPAGLTAKIEEKVIQTLPIFDIIQAEGNIPKRDMFNTFNMGVGMCVVVAKESADKALSIFKAMGENAYVLGEVEKGDSGVILC